MSKNGVHQKYNVTRTDGSSEPRGKHEHCAYFVLDLECDEHAIVALKAYAKACRKDKPELAADLDQIIDNRRVRCGCREAFCPHVRIGPDGESEMAHHLMRMAARRWKA